MRRRALLKFALVLTGICALFLSVGALRSFVRAGQPPAWPVVARVHFASRIELQRLADQGFDIWEVRQEYVLIPLSSGQWTALARQGYVLEVDAALTRAVSGIGVQAFQGGYLTVEELYGFLAQTAIAYPDIAQLLDYGQSWQKTTSGAEAGYDLKVLRLTNRAITGTVVAPGALGVTPTKPVFFLMAGIHAREIVTPEIARRFIEALTQEYGREADITWLLDHHEIWVVVSANPDGYKLVEQGYFQRKNTNNGNGGSCDQPPTITNQYGTDLNRNAGFKWNRSGSSADPCAQTYHGPAAASEPEQQALEALLGGLFQDQRGPNDDDLAPPSTTGLFITLHSYGDMVMWPWGWTDAPPPNQAGLQTIAQKLAAFNGYRACRPINCVYYLASGTSDDWAYGTLGIPAFTFEIGSWFFQDYNDAPALWAENRPALLYAAKIARAPYALVQGPEALDLAVDRAVLTATGQITLTATLDDTGSGGQSIRQAVYTIDTPDWITGAVTHSLSAADGAFDQPAEAVWAAIDTTGLSPGQHTLFIRGQDSQGHWGPVSAAFFDDRVFRAYFPLVLLNSGR